MKRKKLKLTSKQKQSIENFIYLVIMAIIFFAMMYYGLATSMYK